MKTAIIVSSKFGTGLRCADFIKSKVDNIDIYDLRKSSKIDLSNYDSVILGASIYASMVTGRMKKFIAKSKAELIGKQLGIFICCLENKEKAGKYITANFGNELEDSAKTKGFFGGIMDYSKLSFIERFLISKLIKIPNGYSTYSQKEIETFIDTFF